MKHGLLPSRIQLEDGAEIVVTTLLGGAIQVPSGILSHAAVRICAIRRSFETIDRFFVVILRLRCACSQDQESDRQCRCRSSSSPWRGNQAATLP
jgi:hypothetical protein